MSSELRPGARLPTVAALAEQLGVGVASVREAYRILVSMGLLDGPAHIKGYTFGKVNFHIPVPKT